MSRSIQCLYLHLENDRNTERAGKDTYRATENVIALFDIYLMYIACLKICKIPYK